MLDCSATTPSQNHCQCHVRELCLPVLCQTPLIHRYQCPSCTAEARARHLLFETLEPVKGHRHTYAILCTIKDAGTPFHKYCMNCQSACIPGTATICCGACRYIFFGSSVVDDASPGTVTLRLVPLSREKRSKFF